MGAPVIGVTASDQAARWGYWDTTATLVPSSYLRSVEGAGGVPILLAAPASGSDDESLATRAADVVVERVDALVLTGGPDLDPARYGQDRHPEGQIPDVARDAYELALVEGCAKRGLPLLAICRGMQLLNVARGGTLVQHLPELDGRPDHLPQAGSFAPRSVNLESGSRLEAILGRTKVVVPCHHHQAVDRIGQDLVVTAMSDDGVIEALEDPGPEFLLAVQWHPEADDERPLFEALVAAARLVSA